MAVLSKVSECGCGHWTFLQTFDKRPCQDKMRKLTPPAPRFEGAVGHFLLSTRGGNQQSVNVSSYEIPDAVGIGQLEGLDI